MCILMIYIPLFEDGLFAAPPVLPPAGIPPGPFRGASPVVVVRWVRRCAAESWEVDFQCRGQEKKGKEENG